MLELRGHHLVDYPNAEPVGLARDRIHELAERVANALGYEPGANIEPIVKRLGGKIERVDTMQVNEIADASIRVHSLSNFDIFVPTDVGPLRERFSIAHELGHYILHFDPSDGPMQATRYGNERVEWEANWFAAGFLMPATMFKEIFEASAGSIAEVASIFRVSLEAARIHAAYHKLL